MQIAFSIFVRFFFSLAVLLHTNLFLFSFVRIFLHTNFVVLPSKTYIFSTVPETQRNEKEWMQFGFFNLFGCYALGRENFPHEKWSLIVDISAFRCGLKSKRGAQHTERLSQIHTKTHTNWTRKKNDYGRDERQQQIGKKVNRIRFWYSPMMFHNKNCIREFCIGVCQCHNHCLLCFFR